MMVAWAKPVLTETQRAVREHFSKGGSFLDLLLLFAALVACVVLLNAARRRQERAKDRESAGDGGRLFDDLMGKVVNSEPQRQFLSRVASALRLQHPSTLLFTPGLFDQTMAQWRKRRGPRDHDSESGDEALVSQIRQDLFGADRQS